MSRIEGLGKVSHTDDQILILGSIASIESLKRGYHYAHPSNRFWKVLSIIYQMDTTTLEDKKELLKTNKIALWDSCQSCLRKGSSDATIKEVIANDIPSFLKENPQIKRVICNGKTSYQTLKKHYPDLAKKVIVCPSTSAANAQATLYDLVKEYRKAFGLDMKKIYWAKVKEDAIVPTKRWEDAGYDLYPCFEEDYIEIAPNQTKLVPLGVASAFDPKYVLFLKERGSTGTKGMAQRSGVIDSGYRGEYMAPVTNVNTKTIRIAKKAVVETWSAEEKEGLLIYPYEKAICQGVLLEMPQIESEEISYEDLQAIESERGAGKLGSSGK